MKLKNIDLVANKLVKAFLTNKLISPIPIRYTKKINQAEKLKRLCETKIDKPIIGFKAGGTGIPLLKKLKEKEPFYAAVYKHNFLKNKKSVRINKYTLKTITNKNIKRFITHMAPCIEIVGYRQRKKGIKSLGDLCSDFGANVKFIIGRKKKFRNIKIGNLKTNISNNRVSHSVNGNTSTVYVSPLNALKFVLNKVRKDKFKLNRNFYVFTGSTVGVVPILSKGFYTGKIEKLGSVKTKII